MILIPERIYLTVFFMSGAEVFVSLEPQGSMIVAAVFVECLLAEKHSTQNDDRFTCEMQKLTLCGFAHVI